MARRLIRVSTSNRLEDFYSSPSDETFIAECVAPPGSEDEEIRAGLSKALLDRNLYYRAFAFAPRFLPTGGLSEEERKQTRQLIWGPASKTVSDPDQNADLTNEIFQTCREIGGLIPGLRDSAGTLHPREIIIDLPFNRAVVTGNNILTRTENGAVDIPNLFFDPEGWSKAYEYQKQAGYIFCAREHRELVSLASRIVFFEKFQIIIGPEGDRASKTSDLIKSEWVETVAANGLSSKECASALLGPTIALARFRPERIELPPTWVSDSPGLASTLCNELNRIFLWGSPAATIVGVENGLEHLAAFATVIEQGGNFVNRQVSEADLQKALRDHLRSRNCQVMEGSEFGGGETDLLLMPETIVVENKVAGETDDPFSAKPGAPSQARRYSMAVLRRVAFVVIGYQPKTEAGYLSPTRRFKIEESGTKTDLHATILLAIPYGQPIPSRAKP